MAPRSSFDSSASAANGVVQPVVRTPVWTTEEMEQATNMPPTVLWADELTVNFNDPATVLGRGAFSVVHRAVLHGARPVAVKKVAIST